MGKLPDNLIDPFEKILYQISNLLLPIFYKLNLTPNMLTTIGNIFGIISIYYLYQKNIIYFIIFSLLRLFFDCSDGEMARKYKMYSKFGDLYDHISDISYLIITVITSLIVINNKFNYLISISLLTLGFLLNWSCESEYFKNTNKKSLFHLNYLCKNKSEDYLKILKYIGAGFYWLYLYIIIILFI